MDSTYVGRVKSVSRARSLPVAAARISTARSPNTTLQSGEWTTPRMPDTRISCEAAVASADPSSPHEAPEDAAIPDGPYRAALRRRWAELIRRVYEVDPLICPRCGSEMRVIGFITQPALIDHILDHLRRREKIPRPPPLSAQPLATPA